MSKKAIILMRFSLTILQKTTTPKSSYAMFWFTFYSTCHSQMYYAFII